MTPKLRWLAAFALLLAFGAGAVRAEEEEEEVRPAAHAVWQLLPPPRPVVAAPSQIVVPPAPPWAPFAVPNPLACPCPVPMPVGMAGYPNGPVFVPCPCMGGTCPAGCCGCPQLENAPQYVVTAKMVKGYDEDAEVNTSPRILVTEGQPAIIHFQGYETANGQSGLHLQMTVSKQGQGAHMELVMSEVSSHDGPAGLRSHTETTEERCNVAFRKPYKIDLKRDVRLEVTVTAEEREERVHTAACVGACPLTEANAEDEESDTPMDTVGMVIGCLGEIIGDAATGAFGWAVSTDNDDMDLTPTAYLEPPPPVVAISPVCPLTRETAARPCQAGCTGCCPNTAAGCCTQCAAAAEAVKVFDVHVRTDAAHDRKCVEITDGAHTTNATADHILIEDNCIHLEGHVRIDSGDASAKMDKCPLRFFGRLRVHICD